jgi:hypothetical protein
MWFNFVLTFLLGMVVLQAGFFLWWRLWASNDPCRFQHLDDNRRIDGPDGS